VHWKIDRDHYYKDLYSLLGLDGIEEAGYFDDTASIDYNIKNSIKVLCTPISPIYKGISTASNPCVLITTGSFCPIHQGHIEMMVSAREAVENAGYNVLAGYISPGHDEYIKLKVKDKAIPIHYRIKKIQELININKLEDWLMPDSWEGIFNAVAVNFTDVVYRLELYLEELFEQKIPVFFVCGGDNARFALTFLQKGHCVVVGRPQFDERYEQYRTRLSSCKNIIWAKGDNALSSTQIRNEKPFSASVLKDLHLRVEGNDSRESFIIDLLKPYFKDIHYAHLTEQQKVYKKISPNNTISLDAYLPGNFNLQVSRFFDLFGTYKLGYTNRPGSHSLKEQLLSIPVGNYCLFDDDIHTGNTIKYAKSLLEKNDQKIEGIIAMNLYENKNQQITEVLDCRDFLIGDINSGLVLSIKDKTVRAPYVYPYVCPFIRASISDPLEFSIAVWKINHVYYSKKEQLLSDCPRPIRQLFEFIGFTANSPLSLICKWHVDLLTMYLGN